MTIVNPIFIHAGLRSGSSYFWGKFRQASSVMAFYEPFSEDLGRMSEAFLRTHGPSTWKSGHAQTEPYYLEYAPLLMENGGIRGFDPSFSYSNYFRTDDSLPDQKQYLESLLDLAESAHGRPVLGFCRSLGRAPWLKREFPEALHLVMIRNPVHQWMSGYQFHKSTGNPYFLLNPVNCARHPGDNPHMQRVHEKLSEEIQRDSFPLDLLYALFLYVYVSGILAALPYADLVVDMDLLSDSFVYRSLIERRIHGLTGLALDFSDCRIANRTTTEPPIDFQRLNHAVLEDFRRFLPERAQEPSFLKDRDPLSLLIKVELSDPGNR